MKVHSFIETFKIFTFKLGKNGGGGGVILSMNAVTKGVRKGHYFPYS